MKKLISIVFILAVALPLLLPAWFLVRQQALRKTAKENLKQALLQTVKVSRKDFVWVKKNKEIRLQGRLFDIKEMITAGDSAVITGLYDEQEDILHDQLGKWQQNQEQNKSKLLTAVFSQLIFHEQPVAEPAEQVIRIQVSYNLFNNSLLSHPYIPIPAPPPDC